MQWTLTDRTAAVNHAPVVFVNESTGGPEPLLLECEADEKLILDASKSYDPDGDTIYFHWFQCREPTGVAGLLREMIPDLEITYLDPEASGRRVELKMPPPEVCCLDHMSGNPLEKGQVYHFVLEVSDSGTPSLTTYKRIVIQTTNRKLLGGRPNSVDTNAEWLLLRR